MPQICKVCTHPQRPAIETALVARRPCSEISALFGVSGDSLQRHKSDHLPAKLAKAKGAKDASNADDLLKHVRTLQGKATALLLKAEAEGDYRTALQGIREARSCIELMAKLLGQLDERPQINVAVSVEWLQIRSVVVHALESFPAARVAVAEALSEMEGGA